VSEDTAVISFRGQRVSLRPLQAQDRLLLEDLVGRTELHDLRMRFFDGWRRLSPNVLDQLMLIDPQRPITLIASRTASCGKPEILAIARAR
jgi:hypothetical protein